MWLSNKKTAIISLASTKRSFFGTKTRNAFCEVGPPSSKRDMSKSVVQMLSYYISIHVLYLWVVCMANLSLKFLQGLTCCNQFTVLCFADRHFRLCVPTGRLLIRTKQQAFLSVMRLYGWQWIFGDVRPIWSHSSIQLHHEQNNSMLRPGGDLDLRPFSF